MSEYFGGGGSIYTKRKQLEFQVVFFSYLLIAVGSVSIALVVLHGAGKLDASFFKGSFILDAALPVAISAVVTTIVILRKFNYHFEKMPLWQCAGRSLRETLIFACNWATLLILAKNGVSASRYFFGTTLLFNFILMTAEWMYISAVVVDNFHKSPSATYVGVVTNSRRAEKLVQTLKKDWARKVVGLCLIDEKTGGEQKTVCKIPVTSTAETLIEQVKRDAIDEVFIEIEEDERPLVMEAAREMICMGIRVHINIPEIVKLEKTVTEKALAEISGYSKQQIQEDSDTPIQQTIYTRELEYGFNNRPALILDRPHKRVRQQIMKRAIDIAGSIVGLVIAGVLTLVLGPMIKHDSPGPIFFGQVRIGKNGRKFKMYKFRSMYQDAEAHLKELLAKNEMNGLMFKMEDDPRITKIGRFIRKTSLDEFPQFWNVLKGEMSLVGTRPPTVSEFNQYNSYHKRRLSMKPGMTGLWQVSGRSDIKDFEEVVRLDCQYIDNWSIRGDIKILFKTIGLAFKRDNGAS